jgi:hypothetical protein
MLNDMMQLPHAASLPYQMFMQSAYMAAEPAH